LSAPTVFLSALVGMPPLLVTSVYAAGTQMSAATFGAICLVGRSVRFMPVYVHQRLVDQARCDPSLVSNDRSVLTTDQQAQAAASTTPSTTRPPRSQP
jgi:hypothetical protein